MSTRTAMVRLPSGQLAVLCVGALAIAYPDKFVALLHTTATSLLTNGSNNHSNGNGSASPVAPIVIHQLGSNGGGSGGSSSGTTRTILQLVVGAGVCWGSYVVMTNVLPEAAKSLLPVTTGTFNHAISSLGRAVLHLKDTFLEEIMGLSQKQDELSEKQDQCTKEVRQVQQNVGEVKSNLKLVQESITLCHQSLSESERRSAHIARGVQLLTRGVSTFLPENDPLLHDLREFNRASEDEERYKNPAQLHQLQQLLLSLQKRQDNPKLTSPTANRPGPIPFPSRSGVFRSNAESPPTLTPEAVSSSNDDPENELPSMPRDPATNINEADRYVMEVRALLDRVGFQGLAEVA